MASKRRGIERRDGAGAFRMRNAVARRLRGERALVPGAGKPNVAAGLIQPRGRRLGR